METNLIQLAEKYGLSLRRVGSNKYQCRCPYPEHKDSTPSFTLYEDTNSFYCFGCHRSGSWRDFLALVDPQELKKYVIDVEKLESLLLKSGQPNMRESLMLQSAVLFHEYLKIKDPRAVMEVMRDFDAAVSSDVFEKITCTDQIYILRKLEELLQKC